MVELRFVQLFERAMLEEVQRRIIYPSDSTPDQIAFIIIRRTMQTGNQCCRAFKAISIQSSFEKTSLYSIHHIYVAPQALKDMGLSWGQSVGVTTMSSSKNRLIRSFVFSNQTLRKDEVILGEGVANALGYHKSGMEMILLHPQQSETNTAKNYLYPEMNSEEGNFKFSKPSSPLNFSPCIYCKKQKYQLMAFVAEGILKVQVKSYIRRNYTKNIKLLQGIDQEQIGLDYSKILNCLNQPESHNVLPEMGIVLLKPDGDQGPKFQIKLKEVPHVFSLDTEMIVAYIQSTKKESKEVSFDGSKTSFSKNQNYQFPDEIHLTPITAANTNSHTNGGKSAPRNSQISNTFFPNIPPMLKKRKESSCEEHKAKKFLANEEIDPKVKILETKMMKLEDEIRSLKEGQEKLLKKSEKNIIKVQEISRETNERLNAIVKEDWLAVEKVKKQMEAIHKQFSESSQCTKKMIKTSLVEMDRKLRQFSINCSRISSNAGNEKEERESEAVVIPFTPKVDRNSPNIKEFEIEGLYRQTICKKGKDAWAQIMSSQPFVFGKKGSCTMRVLKSKFNFIMLGIVDKKMINNVSSWTRDRSFVFMGWNGVLYANGEKMEQTGHQFSLESDIVMEVEPESGMIHWCLNDRRFSLFSKVIKQEEIEWVPYIELFCKGDTVQWQ